MTLFLAGVFLLIAAFAVSYLWNLKGRLLLTYLRVQVGDYSKHEQGWCPHCKRRFNFAGEAPAADLYHREWDCMGSQR